MRSLSSLGLTALFVAFSIASAPLTAQADELPVINDLAIRKELAEKIGELVDAEKTTPGKELEKQLSRSSHPFTPAKPASQAKKSLYRDCVDSVVAITSVYKCDNCTKWHAAGAATGWILSEDGIMVSNYHVFESKPNGKNVAGFGIRTRDGRFAPIVEILAASKKNDTAIFRVDGKGFQPLPLAGDAEVGSQVHIIAHPDTRFFSYTSGHVSRYYNKPTRKQDGPVMMAVTAEFARGSSGGPVMDDAGNVVGMVTSTQSIYYPSRNKAEKRGPLQMVIKNCIPARSIKELLSDTKK